ncbi:MAG: hypothetical protein Q8P02_04530 [Candidatus Micrarchaeota archaeon]|nr:hypothetical protein [Candidatus Micrarchaeota archaeon]
MVSLTLSIPEELKRRMQGHPEIRWSNVVRSIIQRNLDDLEEADRLASKSRLTLNDVRTMAEKVDAAMAKQWDEITRETDR